LYPSRLKFCCSRIDSGSISRHIGCPGGDGSSGLFLAIVMSVIGFMMMLGRKTRWVISVIVEWWLVIDDDYYFLIDDECADDSWSLIWYVVGENM
jgi:hypothetical protein